MDSELFDCLFEVALGSSWASRSAGRMTLKIEPEFVPAVVEAGVDSTRMRPLCS